MRLWVLALVLAVIGPADALAKDAKVIKLRDSDPNPKAAAKAPLKAKPTPKKHAAKRVVKKAPARKKVVAKKSKKSKPKHDDDDSKKREPEVRPMP